MLAYSKEFFLEIWNKRQSTLLSSGEADTIQRSPYKSCFVYWPSCLKNAKAASGGTYSKLGRVFWEVAQFQNFQCGKNSM